jgi:hypothetical protein
MRERFLHAAGYVREERPDPDHRADRRHRAYRRHLRLRVGPMGPICIGQVTDPDLRLRHLASVTWTWR